MHLKFVTINDELMFQQQTISTQIQLKEEIKDCNTAMLVFKPQKLTWALCGTQRVTQDSNVVMDIHVKCFFSSPQCPPLPRA